MAISATHSQKYLEQLSAISLTIDYEQIERIVKDLVKLRKRHGRIFFLGVGGGAANASHAVNDFRKLCEIECYAPTDNVAELTARTNDEGFEYIFMDWLNISNINKEDALFVLSVGGGTKDISSNIVNAVAYANSYHASIYGIVGRTGGYTKLHSDNGEVIVIPAPSQWTTAFTESFQAIIWHCIVFHPDLLIHDGKWENHDRAI